ncbi:MAG: hypothetical protein AAF269_15060 [Pseudomonadota bacterium]
MTYNNSIALSVIILSAACATTPSDPPPSAVLDISAKSCGPSIDLEDWIALQPEKKRKQHSVVVPVNSEAPCFTSETGNRNYALMKLPDHGKDELVITIGGYKEAVRTLAASVTILREDGSLRRAFEDGDYMSRSNARAIQFRPREQDHFILVETDPAMVGDAVSTVAQNLTSRQNSVYAGGGYTASYSTLRGSETSSHRTYSHEGAVLVRMQALSGHIGIPE